ncbi:hypothetical protein EAH86_04900 [Pedococcus bigeumensis]|uniref:Uncharacterized protein n=1 Tax=Pedococcus bigeumensis TaxID=433644 RepID=A0A502D2H2_9MICO|nr:hypothetical protein EAH86_04900 [Pedococcus bigeumensis]
MVLVLGGFLLVACGAVTTESDGSTVDSGVTAPRSYAPEPSSGSPSNASPELTLTGTVEAGVEKGCLVLVGNGTAYVLIGELAGVVPGSRATVRGHEATNVRTTCQQGSPFRVTAVVEATVGTDPAT